MTNDTGIGAGDVVDLEAAKSARLAAQEEAVGGRACIDATDKDDEQLAQAVWGALRLRPGVEEALYLSASRGGLVLVDEDDGELRIRPGTAKRLRPFLASHVAGTVRSENGSRPWKVSQAFAEYVAHMEPPDWLRRLRAVHRCPVWVAAPDGPELVVSDYHAPTGTLVHCPAGVEPITPSGHTAEDAAQAVAQLKDLLADFPLEDDASFAHALSLALSVVARPLIDGPVPLHLIRAPTPGTGKSLLAKTLTLAATWSSPYMRTAPHAAEEWRKAITATLSAQPAVVCLDNVSRVLSDDALNAVLTETVWGDRLLGASEAVRLRNDAVWVATGNNPRLSGEVSRRTVSCRLVPVTEQPEQRTGFRHRLPAAATAPTIRAALDTLVLRWVSLGSPPPPNCVPTIGSFEEWRRVVGGILGACAVPGLLANWERERASVNGDLAEWRAVVTAWADRYGTAPVRVAELLPVCEDADAFADRLGKGGEASDRSRSTRLGRLLRAADGRVFGDWRVRVLPRDRHNKTGRYQLEPVATKPAVDPKCAR